MGLRTRLFKAMGFEPTRPRARAYQGARVSRLTADWVPDGFGTADVVILSKHTIRVIDLKFGKGVPVSAIDNTQLRLYALGAYSKFKEEYPDIKEVSYTIHQPRLDSISTDGTTVNKLIDWANYFLLW